ncbi:hypothetical protein T4B_2191 [Trichinella pseudospiralis]|uniref:Uncharacterized protein n=1 Tax=Trichinella pseudospiralis TaxID=6337 RepID=A0A0V1ESJ2_TRIPS|nr:hypothetical protein T4A_6825 [Trichinella pseudospiralis]KRZ12532.1 hypothetical protein T4B_2191 [Trichinella pseudospiralis]KRZ45313.1 hypothetical protein T4C_1533 [Trichinella pseudospiralis]
MTMLTYKKMENITSFEFAIFWSSFFPAALSDRSESAKYLLKRFPTAAAFHKLQEMISCLLRS